MWRVQLLSGWPCVVSMPLSGWPCVAGTAAQWVAMCGEYAAEWVAGTAAQWVAMCGEYAAQWVAMCGGYSC